MTTLIPCLLGLLLWTLMHSIYGFSPSLEFKALRGLDVISAQDGQAKDVQTLILENDPGMSVLLCFRSFG